jgi:hypothetical protein
LEQYYDNHQSSVRHAHQGLPESPIYTSVNSFAADPLAARRPQGQPEEIKDFLNVTTPIDLAVHRRTVESRDSERSLYADFE